MTYLTNPYRFGAPFVCPATLAPPNLYAPNAIAVDFTRGCVLYEKNPDTVRPMFSISKVLNAFVLLDYKSGAGLLDTATVTNADVTGSPGAQAGLQDGDVISYDGLLYGLLCAGGNDASKTIARTIGDLIYAQAGNTGAQGITRFVEAMNAKAAALGLSTVVITDPGGYTTRDNADVDTSTLLSRGSARDVARLIGLAYADTDIEHYSDTASVNVPVTGPNARTIAMTNVNTLFDRPGVVIAKDGGQDVGTDAYDRRVKGFGWLAPNGSLVCVAALGDIFEPQAVRGADIVCGQLPQDFPYLDPLGTLIPTDANWTDVKLLIGGDAAIADESSAAHSITTSGATRVSSPRLLGTHSIQFDGTDDYLEIADSADWAFGSGDFTVELFWRATGGLPGDSKALIGQWHSTTNQRSWLLQYNTSGTSLFGFVSFDGTSSLSASMFMGASNFNGATQYTALVRQGSNLWLVNNNQISSATNVGASSLFNSTALLTIGAFRGGSGGLQEFWGGEIDEVRITKGVARLTSAPTIVPARKWPRSGP